MISHHELIGVVRSGITTLGRDCIVDTHARLPLVHWKLVLYVLSAIYIRWWLVIVCLRKTVHLLRNLERRKLAAWLNE